MRLIAATILSTIITNAVFSEILRVPDVFTTIQAAADSSAPGDTILLSPIQYEESVTAPAWDITIAGAYLLTGDTTLIAQTRLLPDQSGLLRPIIGNGSDSLPLLRVVGIFFDGRQFHNYGVFASRRSLKLEHCILDSCSDINSVIYAQDSEVLVKASRLFRCAGTIGGVLGQFFECITYIDSCSFTNSYARGPVSEEFVIRNGTFEMRDCTLRHLGHDRPEFPSFTNIFFTSDSVSSVRVVGNVFEDCLINELVREPRDSLAVVVFDSNTVRNCGIFGHVVTNANMSPNSRIMMRDNIFVDNTDVPGVSGGQGFFVIAPDPPNEVIITGNLCLRNFNRDNSCGCMSGTSENRSISRNWFIENSNEAFVRPPGGAVMVFDNSRGQLEYNLFRNNVGYAVNHFQFTPLGYARNNYWNHESGPYHPSLNPFGQGDSVDTLVVFEPWEIDTSFLQDAVSLPQPSVPTGFLIGRVYPNPFNSEIEIEYVITGTHDVKLSICDLLGREVSVLVNEQQPIGIHRARWQPENRSSGLYFARLHTLGSPQKPSIKKLVYLK
ncbi:T9SS type A sorting domain-containing protein [bacterium]|nr:T9SS type A sorting domain-containing protein [bacterium]MBU1637250.1 T9SS type A sorting domain-containing protein [bacterium]MBU1920267.1 T9SS type A sorting domain-containing protein [bacterium]